MNKNIPVFNDRKSFLESLPQELSLTIIDAFGKMWDILRNDATLPGSSNVVMVSISGGSDSDVMLDMIERVGYPGVALHYEFFDTGVEYKVTKKHLDFLEEKYGITISRNSAKIPVAVAVKRYGQPFLSKQVSEFMSRLQKHSFKWEDEPFDVLWGRYPNCKAALRWWCDEWGEGSRMSINRNKLLKEFITENPPSFRISSKCCDGAKKNVAALIERELNPDISLTGVRKFEGGARATAYHSCYDSKTITSPGKYRPLFWFTDQDKADYDQVFEITHSDAYSHYGLKRTGCAGCPFGRRRDVELKAADENEPSLAKAIREIFSDSYAYTKQYYEFRKERESR